MPEPERIDRRRTALIAYDVCRRALEPSDPTRKAAMRPVLRQLGRDRGHAHYLGGAVLLWVCWLTAIGVGAAAGGGLPSWLHLEFVIPLYLVGQAISKLADPALRRAIFVAAAVALLALTAPLQLGIALAIAAGVAAGLTARPVGPTRSIHPLQPSTEIPR